MSSCWFARWLVAAIFAACGAAGPTHETPPPPPPPADADADRIARADDRCPDVAEVYNGFEDDDGCADRPPADREHCVWVDVIAIADRIYFESASARAAEPSVLDAVAAALVANPAVDRVAVVGGRASDETREIPAQRADAVVRALVERGVAPERLESHGLAEPLGDANADADRSVWFVVLSLDGEPLAPEGEARLRPWQRDCEASRRAWRDRGAAIDCDCL